MAQTMSHYMPRVMLARGAHSISTMTIPKSRDLDYSTHVYKASTLKKVCKDSVETGERQSQERKWLITRGERTHGHGSSHIGAKNGTQPSARRSDPKTLACKTYTMESLMSQTNGGSDSRSQGPSCEGKQRPLYCKTSALEGPMRKSSSPPAAAPHRDIWRIRNRTGMKMLE